MDIWGKSHSPNASIRFTCKLAWRGKGVCYC